MSSEGRTTTRAVRPWRSAFMLERTLPVGEVGPWDFSALRRLAAYWAGDGICSLFGSRSTTASQAIEVLERWHGFANVRQRQAGVEMEMSVIYFLCL